MRQAQVETVPRDTMRVPSQPTSAGRGAKGRTCPKTRPDGTGEAWAMPYRDTIKAYRNTIKSVQIWDCNNRTCPIVRQGHYVPNVTPHIVCPSIGHVAITVPTPYVVVSHWCHTLYVVCLGIGQ